MSVFDLQAAAARFHVEPSRPLAPYVREADSVDAALAAADAAMERTGGNRREALLCAVERLRQDLGPIVNGPRRQAKRVSAKARRQALAVLDAWIAAGRGR